MKRDVWTSPASKVFMTDPRSFARYDETPDAHFYLEARLVEHIDSHAIAAVERLYRELLPPAATCSI